MNPGQSCRWTATDLNSDQLIGAGDIEVDIDSLATLVGVPIVPGMGTRLATDCGPVHPTVELLEGDWSTGCFEFAGAGGAQSSLLMFSVDGSSSVFEGRSFSDLNCTVPVGPVDRIEDTLVFPGDTANTALGEAPFIDFFNGSSTRFSIFAIDEDDRLYFGDGISNTPENRPLTLDLFFFHERL